MGATNTTANYSLSQFIGTDKPAWLQDYNGDMLKIDTGINAAKVAADGAQNSASAAQNDATTANNAITNTINPAISSLNTTVGNQGGAINTINSLIGNGTPTTTDQTIIGAINEINANVNDLSDGESVIVTGATMESGVAHTISRSGSLTNIDCSFTPDSAISAGTPLFTISADYMARINALKTIIIYVLDGTSAFVVGAINQNNGTVYSDSALNAGVKYKISATIYNNL